MPSAHRWEQGDEIPPHLEAAIFDRTLDVGWRRASYSSITSGLHDQPVVGSEPEQQLTSDEDVPVAPGHVGKRARPPGTARSPCTWPTCPGAHWWARSFTACSSTPSSTSPDLAGVVSVALAEEVAWRNVSLGSTDAVVSGCAPPSRARSGRWWMDRRLRDIARGDRLDELTFEIPLVGGDEAHGELAHRGCGGSL